MDAGIFAVLLAVLSIQAIPSSRMATAGVITSFKELVAMTSSQKRPDEQKNLAELIQLAMLAKLLLEIIKLAGEVFK